MAKTSIPLSMRPAGLKGRLFGLIMEQTNKPNYELALTLLKPRPGQAILEIGFGTGKLLEMLAKDCDALGLAGIEPTDTMIDTARKRPAFRNLQHPIDLRRGEAECLPWETATFDAVCALNCFQFWQDPQKTASEVRRVLRPGGQLLVILRDHSRDAPDWLPNPISRSGDEVASAIALFQTTGFDDARGVPNSKGIQAIVASRKG